MSSSDEMKQAIAEYGAEPLEMADTLDFECQPSCWGTCCKGIDIMLAPFDVYQIAKAKSKTMTQVLTDHCDVLPDGNSKFPVVRLRDAATGPCEFLRPDGGCDAREYRPSVCRSSPVGRMMTFDAESGSPDQSQLILQLPHPMCQKKNSQPVTSKPIVQDWLKSSEMEKWWTGTDTYYSLMSWSITKLEFPLWVTEMTFDVLMTFLYSCDQLVPAGTPEDEMFRRSIEAAKHLTTILAAGYSYGPRADEASELLTVQGIQGALTIMETGTFDPTPIAQEEQGEALLEGFVVFNPATREIVKKFDSFKLLDAQSLLAFLTESAQAFKPVHNWTVALNPDASQCVPADEMLRKSKMAEIRRNRQQRLNVMR